VSPADLLALGKTAVEIAGQLLPQIHDYLTGGPEPSLERLPDTLKSRIAYTRAVARAEGSSG